jgi:hypothetical protein
MIIPPNIIENNLYTIGGEFINKDTYKDYQGYYYELNNRYFAVKEFNVNAPEIVKKDSVRVNNLIVNPLTSTYGQLTQTTITSNNITSIPFSPSADDLAKPFIPRYFVKKTQQNPPIIKEVDYDTFTKVKTDPLYQTIKVNFSYGLTDEDLNKLDTKMSGIGAYLASEEPETSSDEANEFIKIIPPTPIPPPPTGSVTDTPKLQDIVPVGPIYIIK